MFCCGPPVTSVFAHTCTYSSLGADVLSLFLCLDPRKSRTAEVLGGSVSLLPDLRHGEGHCSSLFTPVGVLVLGIPGSHNPCRHPSNLCTAGTLGIDDISTNSHNSETRPLTTVSNQVIIQLAIYLCPSSSLYNVSPLTLGSTRMLQ